MSIPLVACTSYSGGQTTQTPIGKAPTPSVGNQATQTPGKAAFIPLISRSVPAFASSASYPASNANDDSYDTTWRSQGTPAWLAYDLSGVPASQRGKVLVAWYNETYNYDHTIIRYDAYNMPQDYTIDVNAGRGGNSPPGTGWITLVTVKGNHYHSREHVVDMAGKNWIRMNVTAVDGSVQNFDASINLDIYSASYGAVEDWIFFGDSITAGAMGHSTTGGVKSFAQLINARLNYVTMVQAVLHAGKSPVVPRIPWGRTANIQNCGPALNARIDALYQAFPQIIKGPDLWTFFLHNQNLISNDNIHPTDAGFGAYRQQWANAMLTEVYKS